MPEKGIKMWCKHDKGRMQQVRTAYGLSEGIHPQAGAFGQGAVESPMGFVSLMSWTCDFIEQKCPDKDPYVYDSGSHENLKITKSIYCEDATYFSRSLKGSQALSTTVGIFGAYLLQRRCLYEGFSLDAKSKGRVVYSTLPLNF